MKSKITLKTGEVIEFEPLKYNEEGLAKLRSHNNEADGEGLWAVLSLEDKVKYNDDTVTGEYFIAMLANSSLFSPFEGEPWGLHVVARFNGEQRPDINWDWVDYSKKENRIFSEDVPEDKRY